MSARAQGAGCFETVGNRSERCRYDARQACLLPPYHRTRTVSRITRSSARAYGHGLVVALAAASVAAPTVVAQQARHAPRTQISIPVERYHVPNGLTVILSPDHAVPTTAVDVWYHVGSKNEVQGRTG